MSLAGIDHANVARSFPDHAIPREEGVAGQESSEWQWIVDPIDGTVNYFYGIPHFCISIALRHAEEIQLGVIYDPMRDEMWAVARGNKPTLNGASIAVSRRTQLADAVLSVGFSKTAATIAAGLPLLEKYVGRARKCRLMGSAALDLAYVACGRLDAYIEQSVSLWDVAAGQLLVEPRVEDSRAPPAKTRPGKSPWSRRMEKSTSPYDALRNRLRRASLCRRAPADSRRSRDSAFARTRRHSDADVLCHAIADAILGAIGERDIGHHFPNTDESIAGSAVSKLSAKPWISCEARRQGVECRCLRRHRSAENCAAPRRDEGESRGSDRISAKRVGLKATTNEHLGFIGRGEGIAALAVASVEVTDLAV
jgi:myo-inositol-1(or 4)-monophosphatase